MPEEFTLEQFEEQNKPEPTVDKSAEIQTELEKVKEALRISEAARMAASHIAAPAPEAPAAPEAPPVKTREELTTMFQEDPVGAFEYLQNMTLGVVAQHVDNRLNPLASSAINSVERDARERYKTEFELFGDDIEKFKAQVPDKSVLTNPAAWDDMLQYIRGKSGNLEKYVAHVVRNERDEARDFQSASAGFSGRGGNSSITSGGGSSNHGLDATQRQIADTLGISYADYSKWDKVG